ncbi:helicase protein mom1 [Phtheirospermum japonicum]|uniref:Helicase protein mom1 n=1 Tax=Phtheirospermum japonicum TaxID=374723 RepID=A0A830BCH6_9LAMI|nr:helicase protein mom1 [Phtheirospermum japonicum]
MQLSRMVSDTRSARNSKDEGDGPSSKKKEDIRKDSTMRSPGKAQASGVRRSARETSNSRQKTPSPQRKSKRLEKGTPPLAPTLKRKSERLEKHKTPSPVRRSDRGKRGFSPSSSDSKKSAKGLGLSESKRKKEKNLTEVTMESEKAELDLESVGMKRKKMNARSFMALFKRQRIKIVPDGDGVLDGRDKLSDGCSDCSRGIVSEPMGNREDVSDECSRRIVRELRDESIDIDKASDGALQKSIYSLKDCHENFQNNGNMDSSCRDNVLDEPCSKSSHTSLSVGETVDCSERLPTNCSSTENMDAPESESSTCLAKTGGGSLQRLFLLRHLCVKTAIFWALVFYAPRTKGAVEHAAHKCLMLCDECCIPLCNRTLLHFHVYWRIGYNSPEQELCSCNPTVDEDLGSFSSCKGRSDNEAAVISETAEKRDSRHHLTEVRAYSQMDGHENVCALCNKSGELLCCQGKGCKRFYHLCCLDPQLTDALPGVWHCPQCVKKKLLFGVHSVSEGIESIWDVRETEVSNVKGIRQRQYLVKYHGLAHIHNHWVPEKQLLFENSCLVSNFIEKDQIVSWSTEWTVPHRLLRKRSIQDNIYIASSSVILVCNYEWLVKWHGLGYDHATWELDNAYCLSSPQGQNLMKDYETRCERAKQKADQESEDVTVDPVGEENGKEWGEPGCENEICPELQIVSAVTHGRVSQLEINLLASQHAQVDSLLSHHKESIDKLSELPASQLLVNDNDVLKNVNKLRECVFKCQNAVVFDDQERAMTIALCLRSMSETCQPFLIVTDSSSLSQWESEFARLVPSVDVVVYSGNSDTRKGIRASEFYDEGGNLMLQVLLSSVEAVLEDLGRLISIKWKAIVIDDHHQFGISNDHGQIKMLPTNSRILLVTGQIKDTTSEYLKMLSLLESHGDLDKLRGLKSETNDHLCRLKDRLSRFIAYGNDSQISKFLEYWVPVQISKYQLEQYCATLLDNSVHLRSCSRNDRVGALHDVLLTARKCCDHPYYLDLSVQERLIADKRPAAEILDIGIKASGKLELLDMMLKEIKIRGLQALVLFQLINGSGGASIGNFLDDFLRQRFGPGTFERVEYSVNPSKKQAAVNRFNKKETGQFIFLLENRACSPTIKLPSLDVVVIYNSDWNPANDLRALQKLSIGSKVEQIKVFRLYSSFTVEERALVLAKQNLNLDNNLQNNFSRTTSDTLLSWGAIHLFGKLDEYHADGSSSSDLNFSSGQLLLSEVTKEFQAILSENTDSNSVISKVKLGVGSYSTDIPMLGEAKVQLKDGEERHVFWRNLLDGKNYIWKHLRGPSPRNRKRIHYFEGCSSKLATEGDDAAKKRKKMVDDSLDPALVQVELGPSQVSQVAVSKEGNRYHSKQGSSAIKVSNQSQNLQKDCNTSNNNPNDMSEERIVSSDERKTLHSSLQAEMMRLCQVLKFSEDVTDIVLRFLEYVIKNRDVNSDSQSVVQALQISLCWIAASIKKQKIDKKDSLMLAKQLLNYQCTEEQARSVYLILKEMYLQSSEKIVISDRHCVSVEEDISKEKAAASEVDYKIKKIQKLCSKRMKRLLRKHQEQLQELHRKWEEQRVKLERDHKVESAFIRSIHGEGSVRTDKLERLSRDLAAKMKDLDLQKDEELKDLEAKHLADLNEESRKAAQWLAETKPFSSGLGAVNEPQSLGHQPEEHVVEGPQPSTPAEAIGCETRFENLVTVDSQNEVGVSSLVTIEQANQSKHSSDNEETGLANLPASVEQVSDKIRSLGNVHEVVGHIDPVEESNASEKISDKGCEIASPDALVKQRCGPDEATSGELKSPRQPSVPSKQTVALSDCCDLSPQQVQQDKTDQSMTPAELQDLDEPAVENQSILRSEAEPIDSVNSVPPIHEAPMTNETVTPPSNHEAPVTDETVIPVPSNHEAPVTDETATPVPSNHEAPTENSVLVDRSLSGNQFPPIEDNDQGRNSPQTAEPKGTDVLSHESIPQSGEDIHNNHPNTRPVSSVAHGQSAQLSAPSQNDVTIPQVVVSTAERPNQAVLQLGIDPSCLLLPTHQPTSGISPPSLLADPLQIELENLRREAEQLEKTHREMASQLKSDCEKEIQEIIAQIRHKYEVKHQDNEAEFKLKRNELDKNQKKVLMNKILAAVFRTKCADPRPCGVPAMQQGVTSSFVQHMHQLSLLPSIRPPGASACPPAPTQPITAPSVQSVQQLSRSHPVRSPPIVNQNIANPPVKSPTIVTQNVATPPVRSPTILTQNVATPPVRSPTILNQNVATPPVRSPTILTQNVATPPVRSPTILNQNVATPPVQAVQNTAALFSGAPSRPPLISTITPSRNSRAGGEIRSAAPHLQSFRPSVAASVSLATSPSVPQLRPPLQRLPPPAPTLLPPLTNLVVSQNRVALQGGLPAPPNPSPSAPGSVVGFDRRPSGPENRTSGLPEICPTFGTLEPSDLEVLGNVQASDVVCLSDDD